MKILNAPLLETDRVVGVLEGEIKEPAVVGMDGFTLKEFKELAAALPPSCRCTASMMRGKLEHGGG